MKRSNGHTKHSRNTSRVISFRKRLSRMALERLSPTFGHVVELTRRHEKASLRTGSCNPGREPAESFLSCRHRRDIRFRTSAQERAGMADAAPPMSRTMTQIARREMATDQRTQQIPTNRVSPIRISTTNFVSFCGDRMDWKWSVRTGLINGEVQGLWSTSADSRRDFDRLILSRGVQSCLSTTTSLI
jgi:hypothetical protein